MKLGIFGDSFAFPNRVFGGWPVSLAKNMNIGSINYAHSGTSIWYSYKKFLEHAQDFTHIVFVYSSPYRWHVLPDHLSHFHWIIDEEKLNSSPYLDNDQKKDLQTILPAYKFLMDDSFNMFVYQTIFDNVNKFCKNNNIKLVNIITFDDSNTSISLDEAAGSCITGLVSIHNTELSQKNSREIADYIMKVKDVRPCHMNTNNNNVIAQLVEQELNSCTVNVVNAFKDTRLNFDINQIVKMIDDYENFIW